MHRMHLMPFEEEQRYANPWKLGNRTWSTGMKNVLFFDRKNLRTTGQEDNEEMFTYFGGYKKTEEMIMIFIEKIRGKDAV